MAMSLSFSWVFYQTSSHELGRQKPPRSYYKGSVVDGTGNRIDFFEQRIDEGRDVLKNKLVLLNMLTLLLGSALSYLLARYTLEPIEKALLSQERFVSNASHEFRTPLTAMLTTNEVSLRKTKISTKEAKDIIKSNNEELYKLSKLTDGLLLLARSEYEPITISSVDPDLVIKNALSQVQNLAQQKNLTLNYSRPKTKAVIKGNHDTLVQLLVILLDNAIKFSPEKSNIDVSQKIQNKEVHISVKDYGPGIAKSDQDKIFDRFYRSDASRNKDKHDGYGIGLAIAKQIAEANNATIAAKSLLGKGTEFTVRLKSA